MVVRGGLARAIHARMEEHHGIDYAVRVSIELGEVDCGVDLGERLPQPGLHAREGTPREQPVAIGPAERVHTIGSTSVGHLIAVERDPTKTLALETEQVVGELLVEGAQRVWLGVGWDSRKQRRDRKSPR